MNLKNQSFFVRLLVVIVVFGAFIGGNVPLVSAENSTWIVDPSGAGDFDSIQDAIDASVDGDIIQINDGVYLENIFVNKGVTLRGSSKNGVVIDGQGTRSVVVIGANGVSLEGISVKNSNDVMTNKTVPSDVSGIYIEGDDVRIQDCSILDCYYALFANDCLNLTITNCSASHNVAGFCLNNSLYGLISNCSLISQENYGVSLQYTRLSTVSLSSISMTSSIGLIFIDSSNNEIYQNTFVDNLYGVRFFRSADSCSNDNMIFRNNFVNNSVNAYDDCRNLWYVGSMGNYWDDYEGVDTDGDGIGDDPYLIPLIGEDRYPLVSEFMGDFSMVNSLYVSAPVENEVVNGTLIVKGTVLSASRFDKLSVRMGTDEWQDFFVNKSFEVSLDTLSFEDGNVTLFLVAEFSDGTNITKSIDIVIDNPKSTEDVSGETSGFTLFIWLISVVLFIFYRKR